MAGSGDPDPGADRALASTNLQWSGLPPERFGRHHNDKVVAVRSEGSVVSTSPVDGNPRRRPICFGAWDKHGKRDIYRQLVFTDHNPAPPCSGSCSTSPVTPSKVCRRPRRRGRLLQILCANSRTNSSETSRQQSVDCLLAMSDQSWPQRRIVWPKPVFRKISGVGRLLYDSTETLTLTSSRALRPGLGDPADDVGRQSPERCNARSAQPAQPPALNVDNGVT